MEKKFKKYIMLIFVFIILIILVLFFISKSQIKIDNIGGTQSAIKNYESEVSKYAKKYNLPKSYLMAVIMLECSGRKYIKPRFEHHIFAKLKKLRDGKISKFEDLTSDDLKNYTDKELKKLSKSYGPFQIMGYKSIKMGIDVDKLDGKSGIKYGIIWINNEYGDKLRHGRFQDAFHLHNTGKLYPKSGKSQTYDPKYVENGMYYLRFFSNL